MRLNFSVSAAARSNPATFTRLSCARQTLGMSPLWVRTTFENAVTSNVGGMP